MTSSTITPQVSQSLDVHGHFSTAITLYNILFLENLTNPVNIVTIQIIAVHGKWKIYFFENLSSRGQPNTVYVS